MDINSTRMFLQLTEYICRMGTSYSHGLTPYYPQLLSGGNDSNTVSSSRGQEGGEKGKWEVIGSAWSGRNKTSMSSTNTRANVLWRKISRNRQHFVIGNYFYIQCIVTSKKLYFKLTHSLKFWSLSGTRYCMILYNQTRICKKIYF